MQKSLTEICRNPGKNLEPRLKLSETALQRAHCHPLIKTIADIIIIINHHHHHHHHIIIILINTITFLRGK